MEREDRDKERKMKPIELTLIEKKDGENISGYVMRHLLRWDHVGFTA
jgi:hypothetical protein